MSLVLSLRPYIPGDDDAAWDALVRTSCNGTFLHTRRFLSYHGDRFVDRSVVLADPKGRLRGVLPAAEEPRRRGTVTSHPGLSYGGLVHDGTIRGERLIGVLREIGAYYAASGARELRYKPTPAIFHRVPAADDIYSLFRLRAERYRCDLSATIDVAERLKPRHGRVHSQQLARKAGIEVDWDWGGIDEYWSILEDNLRERFGVKPAHSLEEIQLLGRLFPDEIRLISARLKGRIVAGGVMFCARPVLHLQYSSADLTGRDLGGPDLVVEAGIAYAREHGYRYYSFGSSTEREGWELNESLYDFKLSFGGGAVVWEHYSLPLLEGCGA